MEYTIDELCKDVHIEDITFTEHENNIVVRLLQQYYFYRTNMDLLYSE